MRTARVCECETAALPFTSFAATVYFEATEEAKMKKRVEVTYEHGCAHHVGLRQFEISKIMKNTLIYITNDMM
jgi:hypothetical protein